MDEKYIKHLLKNIPHKPGVYKMKDKEGKIIYVGKAKDLFKRVSSYFKNISEKDIKTQKMVEHIADIDYSLVSSELEAIMLETNMIKEFRPKYNILMKDDKNFVYVKITTNEDYPRIFITRQIDKDKAKYFGPKTAQHKVVKTLKVLKRILPFRHCHLCIEYMMPLKDGKHQVKVTKAGIKYPCIDFHINRCPGPCVGNVSKEDYRKYIDYIINFFEGNYDDVLNILKQEMIKAAGEKKFESAAAIRDKLKAIEEIMESQDITAPDHQNSDVINYTISNEKIFFNLFQVRKGKVINQDNFELVAKEERGLKEDQEALVSFLEQYYEKATDVPKEILVPHELEERENLEKWLSDLKGQKVEILNPQRGRKDHLLELSYQNALNFAKLSEIKWEGHEKTNRDKALADMAQYIGINEPLKRIECYDISHHGGTETVASMVVFENGFPKKDHYRKFRLHQNVSGQPNDYASIEETIQRRLKYIKPSGGPDVKILKPSKKDLKNVKTEKGFEYFSIKIDKKLAGTVEFINEKENKKIYLRKIDLEKPVLDYKDLIKRISGKTKSNRLYINIDETDDADIEKWLEIGFQEVKKTEENPINSNKLIVINVNKLKDDQSFRQKPDLMIIDGGKGQLNSALKVAKKYKLDVKIVSIAKKNEEIFMSDRESPLMLDKSDPILHMVQHLRDEAHRFANAYRENVYLNTLKSSVIDSIPGIGEKTKMKLLKNFGSMRSVKEATMYELEKVVGKKNAMLIKEKL